MTKKQLLKKIKLSNSELDEIKSAVSNAEKNTTGEIALALTAESNTYSFWELLSSIYFAAIVFIVLLPFAPHINSFYRKFLWQTPDWLIPAFYGIACLASIVVGFFIMNIPAIDRLIIPRTIRNSCVTNRAFRHFAESGVYDTSEHSGILIFVSYIERQVRIIADRGISEKIPQDIWNIIADDLAEGIKLGKTKEGFLSAIEKCSEILSEHFPAYNKDQNELPDGLVILDE
ncbi:MAG: TPM domain-containing protein [Treponemataceae bacterium]|nr:TPM domain-containing protein [Treponemataceae bacterium]